MKTDVIIGLTAIVVAVVILASVFGTSNKVTTTTTTTITTQTGSYNLSTMLHRIVIARVYQQRTWTLQNETPSSVGTAIAKLNPTYVSTLMRLDANNTLTSQMIMDYNTIRSIVLQANPNAKFDLELNAKQYTNGSQLVGKMSAINSQISIDGWFFDFYDQGYSANPSVIESAIAYAHSKGQFVSGNLGAASAAANGSILVPPGSDFATLPTSASPYKRSLNQTELNAIISEYHIPVITHINNNPQLGPDTLSCVFINSWTAQQRQAYIAQLASNQTSGSYTFEYNLFFPQCPVGTAYDSLHDGSSFQVMQQLAVEYNS